MKALKLLTVTSFLMSSFMAASATESKYKCSGNAEGGGEIKEAEVTFSKGLFNSISEVKASVNVWGRTIQKEFRGPVKLPKTNSSVLHSSYLAGKENSGVNPFAHVSYLILDGNTEQVKFSELPSTLPLSIYYTKGAIGNRGSEEFKLTCSKL